MLKKYQPIPPEMFKHNRANFIKEMKPKSIAVFHSNDQFPRSGDTTFPFRQNADLFYLTGIDQEDSYLILFPDCPMEAFREVLYTRKTSETIAIWEGHKYTKKEAQDTSGIDNVKWNDRFESELAMLMNMADNVYINLNENSRAVISVPYRDLRFANELKEKYPLHNLERSAPIMEQLRSIKSRWEVDIMQKACDITGEAWRDVLATVKPGMMEYEVEATILHAFLRNGAAGFAYEPIVASGANACVLHYITNNSECKAGDLLLMDFGCEYGNYASDCTRTIPVSGTFTQRQKDVYNAVLRVQKEVENILAPGITMDEVNKESGKLMEAELIGLGLLDRHDVEKQDPKNPLYKQYFMHGTSHFMGIDVHDVGDRYAPIQEGMCFTNEPGIYIREEGIGVRIEDDIVIREGGNLNMMHNYPKEVEEIEELMNSKVTA